ncbi:hypothetical protein O181_013165 [Austropuccinia psidii MF-1]|uniref:Uncharacterized protein n=1 Tax=Austropuccinia psidii MF-1 TaxID=1389203 RepID=A0A9Q3BYH7_9BASI|nr:hypothetical protein [Austropuccinia psidii MF-1]
MSWFSHYINDQIHSQFLPFNQNLVQAPSQGTSAIGTGEESQIPPLPSYNPLPNCPLKYPNRPYLSFCLTIIGPHVPTNMTPGSQRRPQDTSGHPKGQQTSASSSMPSLGLNQSFVGTNSGPSQLTTKIDKDLQSSGNDSDDSPKGAHDNVFPEKTNCSSF